MSWFWRGFQSAIFYYVSCAPCTKLNYRRKQRLKNKREQAEKADLESAQPDVYKHPPPFRTNIYWREEMVLGPGPPPKKKDRDRMRNGSSRDLNTGGQGSSAGGSSATDTTLVVGSVEGMEVVAERDSGEGWNTRRYQRPDEILWGFDIEEESGVGLSGISRTGTAGSGTRYTARNPAVNDLHPPVVSTHPTRKSETRWMLQPPPSAKVMEGKEKANRSRSVSGGSYGSSKAVSLQRQAGERQMEEKMKRGERRAADVPLLELPSAVRSRGGTNPNDDGPSNPNAAKDPQAQRHDRDPQPQPSTRSDSHRPKRPPPIHISEDSHNRNPTLQRLKSSTQPPRPSSATVSSKPAPLSPDALFPTLTAVTSASSLHVLQELVSPNSALNMRAPSPSQEASVRLPSATECEAWELRLPEVETRWPGAGYRFPETGVGGRWSMDI
ncbi:hypothetical protein MMC30_002246 [Trapelia coarctata]|nr:hypothetical protein [Trapelia coarctata]